MDDRPQAVHNVGMLAALATVVALATPTVDPAHLPSLPPRGLARQTPSGVVLERFDGRVLGLLRGYHVVIPGATHGLLLHRNTPMRYVLDLAARRVRPVARISRLDGPCTVADQTPQRALVVCKRHVDVIAGGRRSVVAGPRRGLGRWMWAEFSPSGKAILAQWSGECESPTAYLIADGRARPYGGSDARESFALGWLSGDRAVVSFRSGICGSGFPTPGIYAVPLRGKPQRLRAFRGRLAPTLAMWGG